MGHAMLFCFFPTGARYYSKCFLSYALMYHQKFYKQNTENANKTRSKINTNHNLLFFRFESCLMPHVLHNSKLVFPPLHLSNWCFIVTARIVGQIRSI